MSIKGFSGQAWLQTEGEGAGETCTQAAAIWLEHAGRVSLGVGGCLGELTLSWSHPLTLSWLSQHLPHLPNWSPGSPLTGPCCALEWHRGAAPPWRPLGGWG